MNTKLFSRLSPKIGIDLGSKTIRICTEADGVVIEQPACLAINVKTQEVVAVGSEAAHMQGRVEPMIEVQWPVVAGVVYDAAHVGAMLKIMLQPLTRWSILTPPIIMVSVPGGSTKVQRQTLTKVVYELGAKEVYTIAQPLAASIGAGVPIADASGSFIFQMGAGVIEAAVISLGSLVRVESSKLAGNQLREQIKQVVQQRKQIEISPEQAETIVHQVVSCDSQFTASILVTGKDVSSGTPSELKITTDDVRAAVAESVAVYPQLVQRLLSHVGPALTVDVIDKGLLISGGLAKLQGLDTYLIHELGMPVAVVDDPEHTTVAGILLTLKHLHEFRQSLGYVT